MSAWLACGLIVAGVWAFFVNDRMGDRATKEWPAALISLPLGALVFLGACGVLSLIYHAV